jgi:hypothetical protein
MITYNPTDKSCPYDVNLRTWPRRYLDSKGPLVTAMYASDGGQYDHHAMIPQPTTRFLYDTKRFL